MLYHNFSTENDFFKLSRSTKCRNEFNCVKTKLVHSDNIPIEKFKFIENLIKWNCNMIILHAFTLVKIICLLSVHNNDNDI